MNGESKQIYDAIGDIKEKIVALGTRQEERHQQNRQDMNSIGNLTRSVEKHCHEIGKLKVHRGIQWYFIGAIIIAIITFGIRNF